MIEGIQFQMVSFSSPIGAVSSDIHECGQTGRRVVLGQ